MRVYLDNCCFNRPYDDQSQFKVSLETQSKLFIQEQIKIGRLELVDSFILRYENNENPFTIRRESILDFIKKYSSYYVDYSGFKTQSSLFSEIMDTGIKKKDAAHVVCAVFGGCEYFLTTDKRLLKYKSDSIEIMNPVSFIDRLEV